MKNSAITMLLVVFALCVNARADIPPDPGFVRHTSNVTIETKEDLAAYRFFIESPGGIEEISVSKEKPFVVSGANRGGSSRYGTFWAIPVASLGADFGITTPEKLDSIRKPLTDEKMVGAVRLFAHSFLATLKKEDVSKWQDPIYRIEKDGETSVKATLISGGTAENKIAESKVAASAYSTEPKSSGFWVTVIGGSLMTFAFILFGVWAIRRSNKPRQI